MHQESLRNCQFCFAIWQTLAHVHRIYTPHPAWCVEKRRSVGYAKYLFTLFSIAALIFATTELIFEYLFVHGISPEWNTTRFFWCCRGIVTLLFATIATQIGALYYTTQGKLNFKANFFAAQELNNSFWVFVVSSSIFLAHPIGRRYLTQSFHDFVM